ncbi:TPA: hypothetical protein ENX78_15045 [Candidatus Poribacteria bacterium]|nr:hypothetical protein [Candidatus Poribacteria bacterium]
MQNNEKISLMDGEELITQLGGLFLTNKRLIYNTVLQKVSETGMATVRDIDSAIIRRNKPSVALLIIGCLLEFMGITTLSTLRQLGITYGFFLIIIGAIMVVLYFSLKEKMIRITVNGGEWLNAPLRQIGSEDAVIDFINKLFEIKDNNFGKAQEKPSSYYDFE